MRPCSRAVPGAAGCPCGLGVHGLHEKSRHQRACGCFEQDPALLVSAGETVAHVRGLSWPVWRLAAAPAPRLAEAARPRAQAGGRVGELAARQRPVEPAAAVRAAADRALGAPRPWPHSRHSMLAPAGWWRPKQRCRLAALLSLFLRPARHRPPEAGTHHGRFGCLSWPTLHQVAALQHVPTALHAGAHRAAADALHQHVVARKVGLRALRAMARRCGRRAAGALAARPCAASLQTMAPRSWCAAASPRPQHCPAVFALLQPVAGDAPAHQRLARESSQCAS